MPLLARLADTGLRLDMPVRNCASRNQESQAKNLQQTSGDIKLRPFYPSPAGKKESPVIRNINQGTIKDWFFNLSPLFGGKRENTETEKNEENKLKTSRQIIYRQQEFNHLNNISAGVDTDQNLEYWLQTLSLSRDTAAVLTTEELTLEDLLETLSREDLRKLGLKIGPELRIWQAVQKHRTGSQ